MDYRLEADGLIDQMAVVANANFNGNFIDDPEGAIWTQTLVFDRDGLLLDDEQIRSLEGDFFLDDEVFLNTLGENELFVSTYALDYRANASNGFGFTSLWNEFDVVPEPCSSVVLFGWQSVCYDVDGRSLKHQKC